MSEKACIDSIIVSGLWNKHYCQVICSPENCYALHNEVNAMLSLGIYVLNMVSKLPEYHATCRLDLGTGHMRSTQISCFSQLTEGGTYSSESSEERRFHAMYLLRGHKRGRYKEDMGHSWQTALSKHQRMHHYETFNALQGYCILNFKSLYVYAS